MTANELIERCQNLTNDQDIEQVLNENCNKITIQLKFVTDNSENKHGFDFKYDRADDCKCPSGYDHHCYECEKFVCSKNNNEEAVFAFMRFDGYCVK